MSDVNVPVAQPQAIDPRIDQARQLYNKTFTDPKFADLPYDQQVQVRGQLAQFAAQSPSFQTLPKTAQAQVMSELTYAPPALEDKGFQAGLQNAVKAAQGGDQNALNSLTFYKNIEEASRGTLVTGMIGHAAAAISDTLGLPDATMGQTLGGMQPKATEALYSADAGKVLSYLSAVGKVDPALSALNGGVNVPVLGNVTAMGAAGQAMDIAGWLMSPAASIGKAIQLGTGVAQKGLLGVNLLAKQGEQIAANATTAMGRIFGRSILPILGETPAAAAFGLAQQNLSALTTGDPTMYTDTAAKIAVTAGMTAAANFGLGLAFREVIPTVFKTAGKTFGRKLGEAPAPRTEEEINAAMERMGGGDVPEELKGQLNQYTQDVVAFRNAYMPAIQKWISGKPLDPYETSLVAAQSLPDFSFVPDEAGGFRAWHVPPKLEGEPLEVPMQAHYDNLDAMNVDLSRIAYSRFLDMDEQGQAYMLDDKNAWMLQVGKTARGIDVAWNGSKPIGDETVGPAIHSIVDAADFNSIAGGVQEAGGTTVRFYLPMNEELAQRLASGKPMMQDVGEYRAVNKPDGANAAFVVKQVAPDAIVSSLRGPDGQLLPGAQMKLLQSGFDGFVNADGSTSTLLPSRVKLLKQPPIEEAAETGRPISASVPNNVFIARKLEASFTPAQFVANKQALADFAITRFRGEIAPEDVKSFADTVLQGVKTGEGAGVGSVRIDPTGKPDAPLNSRVDTEGNLHLETPSRITSPQSQRSFLNSLVENIRSFAEQRGELPKGNPKILSNIPFDSTASRFQMPFEGDVSAQTKWLDGIMQTEFNGILDSSNGKFTPMIGKGGQLVPLGHFNTVQEAYRALAPHFFDDNFIRSDLASQGYNLEKVEGGYRLTGPNLSKPLSGSLRELLPQVGYEFTKIPDRYAPSNVIVDPATVKMTYDGTTLRGPVRDLAKSLDMFFDPKRYAEMTPLGKFKDAGLYKLADGTIEVDIPRYNSKMTFPSEADARRFLAGDVSALSNVERMAQAKALDVRFQNGEWTVNDGRGRMTAKSRADVAAIMATYPDVKPTNELFASIDPNASTGIQQALSSIDPKMLGEWKSITPDFSPYKFYSDMQTPAQVIKEGIRNRLRAEFSDTRYFIDKTFSKYGLTDGQRIVRQIDAAMDAHSPSVYNEYKTLASVFTDSNGKPIPYERRVAIAEYRIAETTEDFKAAQDAFGPLSPDEQKAAERLDTMLGDKIGTNTTALAAKYGIGFQKFYGKGQYLSRVRAYYDANPQVVSKMALGSELNNAIGNVPASVRAWFDNERVSDILNFAAERDPQRILMRYIAAGNKQLYLDGAWRAMNNWMNANKERLPPFVVSKLNRFREQVNGTYQIPGEDFIKGMGRAIVQKVRGSKATPEDLQAGENLASNFYQLTYFTSLGFRPYQAVRNVAQIFTTLAPRIGNDFTMAGLKRALNMSAEEAQHLQGLNVIKPNAPGYENFLEGRTWVRKTMQAGMQWFKNGDDVGRAAAYFAADEALTPAISKLQRGLYGNDIQKFIDDSMLFTMQKLNPTLVNDVLSLVNKGTPEAISQAKATFGAQLAKETFPSFEWWNQPKFYSEHILTRLFGQYGTFATIYRSNLYRAFASGTAAQKAAFAARFIGNNLAIFGALSAMNIKANDFIPGVPALFGGGPNFKLGVDLMQALDSGQNGQEARYNLEREFSPLTYVAPGSRIPFAKTGLHVNYPEVLPGSLQAHFIQKGLKYLQAGDTWKAFLSFTTTPTNP